MIVELRPEPVVYVCGHRPACASRMRADPADARTPMHNCPAATMMSLPMIREGEHADVRLIERGDFLGADAGKVRTDANGRPWMRAEVERSSGQIDVFVYAPTATVASGAEGGRDGQCGGVGLQGTRPGSGRN